MTGKIIRAGVAAVKRAWSAGLGYIALALGLVIVAQPQAVHAQAVTNSDATPSIDWDQVAASTAGLGNRSFNLATDTLLPYVYVTLGIAVTVLALYALWPLIVRGFAAIRGKFSGGGRRRK